MAVLAERHGAWLHVDGAFGLFGALSPKTEHLVAGVERAHSVAVDGHKWLNVPYDTGFAFVHDPATQPAPSPQARPTSGRDALAAGGSGSSPRDVPARTCDPGVGDPRAYGRDGYRAMVERHLALPSAWRRRSMSHPTSSCCRRCT